MSTPSDLVLPKHYHYPLFVLFGVMLLGWILLATLTILLSLIASFSISHLPIPGLLEIIAMLLISLAAAFKLRHIDIIGLTQTGITQAENTIAYDNIGHIELIQKLYLQVLVFHQKNADAKSIFMVCPALLRDHDEFFAYVSSRSGVTIPDIRKTKRII